MIDKQTFIDRFVIAFLATTSENRLARKYAGDAIYPGDAAKAIEQAERAWELYEKEMARRSDHAQEPQA